jgi:tetratricopeptide (TPR) repeat protein
LNPKGYRETAQLLSEVLGDSASLMVVDPSHNYRSTIKNFLQKLNISRVIQVSNFNDAKRLLITSNVKMFIIEWIADGQNGLEFCRELRNTAKYREAPIILMTTENFSQDVIIASEVGIDRYLLKPFSFEVLCDQISILLRAHLHPTYYDVVLQTAGQAYFSKQLDSAEELYLKARELNPSGGRPGLGLARISVSRGDHKKAIQYLRQTIETNPNFIDAHKLLMNIYHELEFLDGYYKEAAALNVLSPDNPIYLVAIAEKALSDGNLQEAERLYKKSVMLSPSMGAAHRGLGDIAFTKEEFERAEKHYKKALDFEPSSISCINSLGMTFIKLGKYKEGMSKYMAALTISPENPKVLFNMGQAWEKQEIYDKATQCYQHALKVDKNFTKARRGIDRILKLQAKGA